MNTENPNPHFNKKLCPSCRSLIPLDASSCLVCNNSSFDDLNEISGALEVKEKGQKSSDPADPDLTNRDHSQAAEKIIQSGRTKRREPENRMTWQFFVITQIVFSVFFSVSKYLYELAANLGSFCLFFVTLILLWTINNYLTGQNKYTVKSLWGFINNFLLTFFIMFLFVLALFLAMLIICGTASW